LDVLRPRLIARARIEERLERQYRAQVGGGVGDLPDRALHDVPELPSRGGCEGENVTPSAAPDTRKRSASGCKIEGTGERVPTYGSAPEGRMKGDAVGVTLEGMIEPLRDRRKVLDQEIEKLSAQMGELKAEASVIDRMLRVVDGEAERSNGASPPKRNRKKGTTTRVSKEREEEVQRFLAESGNGPMTVRQVAAGLQWKPATTNVAINQARERGLVRLVGRDEKAQGKPRTYAAA
jgi:hypothetical protein